MKYPRDNTLVLTALLRNPCGIDTPVKNSLRCTAAGITALRSTTTEVLIPHVKLRGAAPPEATLNAQACPPAQPVVGYTHARSMKQALNFPQDEGAFHGDRS